MAARLEIEIGGTDKGGNAELKETIGLLEQLAQMRQGLNIDLLKAEDVQQIRAVGEDLTKVNLRIGEYMKLATKATQAWRDNRTETILDNLATRLAVLQTNTEVFGTTLQGQSGQLRAYQTAFEQLIENGVDRTSAEVIALEGNIKQLTSAMVAQKAAVGEQKAYDTLSTKLAQISVNFQTYGDATKRTESQIRAFQSTIDSLLKTGISPADTKIQQLQASIVSLQAALKRESTEAFNKSLQNTGSLILDAQRKVERLKQNLTFAKSEKDIERFNRRLSAATNELRRLETVGTSAAKALARVGSQTNQAGTEFARIVQDAPYAAQNIGSIGNNVTRLAELWPQYVAGARATVVANGQIATSANVARAALTGMVTGANGWILAISAVVTAFTIWQQVSQKRARDLEKEKKAEEDFTTILNKRVAAMDAVSQAQATGGSEASSEITRLNVLRTAIENELVPRDKRLAAIKALKDQYPEYFKNLSDEKLLAGQVADVYTNLSSQLLKTALAQAAVRKAIELGQTVIQTETITYDNLQKIATANEEILRLEKEIAKNRALLSTQDAVTGGGFSGQTARVSKEAEAIGIANDAIAEQRKLIAAANTENATYTQSRTKAEKEIANLVQYTNGLVQEGADITDGANKKDKAEKKERVKITKELGAAIQDIYKAESDRGNLVGLDGLFKTNQATQNRYKEMLDSVAKAEADWTKYYQDQVTRRNITAEQSAKEIVNVENIAAQERKQINDALQKEIVANTKAFGTERAKILGEAEAKAGLTRIKSRDQELAADRIYWDGRAKELEKYNVTAEQLTELRKASEAQINAKWDAKIAETAFEYQRKLNESVGQTLLRRLNKETEEKIKAAKGDAEKLLEIEKGYQTQVSALRARDRDVKAQLSFDGSAMSVPLAQVNAQMEALKQNFEQGGISVASFKNQVSTLEVQRQQLQLWQGTLDGIASGFGNLAGNIVFDTENAIKNLGESFKAVAKNIVSELVKIGVRYTINQAIGTASMAATAATSSATAATVASAWATAAALVSAATFGASAVAGGAALSALVISSKALAGFSSGGYTGNRGRREVAGVVHGQEFVVNASATRDNLPLLRALNSGANLSGALPSSPKNINFGSVQTKDQQTINVRVVGEIDNGVIKLANDEGTRNFKRYFGK